MKNTLLLLTLLLLTALPAIAQTQIVASTFSNGAQTLQGSTIRLTATVGQPFAGVASGTTRMADIGFWFVSTSEAGTPIEYAPGDVPARFQLDGNYPNPFNPETTIRYALPEATHVNLTVFDMLGREVAVLVDEPQAPGSYRARFEAESLPSGAYVYRLEAGGVTQTRTMLLVK